MLSSSIIHRACLQQLTNEKSIFYLPKHIYSCIFHVLYKMNAMYFMFWVTIAFCSAAAVWRVNVQTLHVSVCTGGVSVCTGLGSVQLLLLNPLHNLNSLCFTDYSFSASLLRTEELNQPRDRKRSQSIEKIYKNNVYFSYSKTTTKVTLLNTHMKNCSNESLCILWRIISRCLSCYSFKHNLICEMELWTFWLNLENIIMMFTLWDKLRPHRALSHRL